VDAGPYATLAHFPDTPAVWLERGDDTGFQQVLKRADYLAKEHTKAHATGERNFGCRRSGTRQTRQDPANQKYGLLS
ncbi:YagK/YfjJ domain-containing protein, partial [Escherichia coli]|uniref:YagK/YfjJ domain-containing protein n=1 Tax=Escherichia coli TaxID=562 RepID=UPI003D325AE3